MRLFGKSLGRGERSDLAGDRIVVCDGRSCREAGARWIGTAARNAAAGTRIAVDTRRCLKRCEAAPVVLVGRDGEPTTTRFHVRPEEMERIVAELSGINTTKGT